MSKIFETLNKSGGEIADIIRPLIDGQGAPAPGGREETAAVQPQPERSGHPERVLPKSDESGLRPRSRTLHLRVPAPSPLLPFEDGQSVANEQYRILRTKITQHRKQPRLIVVSSPDAGDGKSVSAINVAAALSLKSEARTLLVDADLRKSAVHVQLGLPEAPGLSEVLAGKCTLEEALVQALEFPELYVLTAGTSPANPVELLDSAQWPNLCARIRGMFRFVIVDSPPIAALADYDLIQAACDGMILVTRPDHTNRQLLRKALDTVPKEKLLGVLLNCVPRWPLSKFSGMDHYYQYPSGGTCAKKAETPASERATE